MPDVEIRPFSDEHLDAAAALLAERHARHLTAEPLLGRDVDYRVQLAGKGGLVALRGGELRAYLLGQTTDEDAFVDFAGCAASEPELLRDLYAALAPTWQRERHRVYLPASDAALIDVWFHLAFGLQFTLAVREPAPLGGQRMDQREGFPDHLAQLDRLQRDGHAACLDTADVEHLVDEPQ